MRKHEKTALAAAIELLGVYIATHPHATVDAQRRFWYYTTRLCRLTAEHVGMLGIYAERHYRDMCP